ncbi:pantoate--beta-alanine ligase [Taklimakanibacter lacteus]|uniref:pantoate--beta-alanine ligase n=1 Tax=Taklimakanibacter lacteus TaxID=2268456 RepID=UPI000E661DB8
MTLKIVRNILDLRKETAKWRAEGLASAVVPTMGALHAGHITLVREGLKHADRVVTTIFVNPKQFAAHEDLGRYPRTETSDIAQLEEAGTHLVFAPPPDVVYPPGFVTSVILAGPAKAGLEDKFRPHFFDGVATVVAKLFTQTQADFAMFGEKDYQQLMVVTRMARDLDLPIKVVGVPTVREESGLALSSRNAYLSKAEHHQAAALYQTLTQAARKIRAGQAPSRATAAARRALTTLGFRVDYVAARNAETLALPKDKDEPLRLLVAAWLGKTRLIDNVAV